MISVDKFECGYPNLAAFKDSSESFSVYRRFGYLQSRLLLDRQHELGLLEEELDEFDRDPNNFEQLTSLGDRSPDELKTRRDLFRRIEETYASYGANSPLPQHS